MNKGYTYEKTLLAFIISSLKMFSICCCRLISMVKTMSFPLLPRVKTGIDLPLESTGYTSKDETPGLLLDFVMGQFETYNTLLFL